MVYADSVTPVRVTLPPDARGQTLTLHRVTDSENNILRQWEQMGSPAYLQREQRQSLEAANQLRPATNAIRLEESGQVAAFDLPSAGVALLSIAAKA